MASLKRTKMLIPAVVGVALVLFGLFMMIRSGGDEGESVDAIFDDVTGLVNHSPVLHRGVRVGEVVQIAGEGDSWEKAVLTLKLEPDSGVTLMEDAFVSLRLKSLLGELFLDLDPGSSGTPLQGPITRTHRDTSFDRLIYSGAEAFKNLSAAEETRQIVDEVKRLVETSSDDVVAVTHNAAILVDTLASKDQQIATIISNLDTITASTDQNAGRLGETVVSLNNLLRTMRSQLEANRDRIAEMTDLLRRVVDSTDLAKLDEQLGKLPEYFDKAYEGMRIVDALVHHCIPAAGYLIPFPTDAAVDAYKTAAAWSQNPIMRSFWTKVLESYLGSGQPGCAVG